MLVSKCCLLNKKKHFISTRIKNVTFVLYLQKQRRQRVLLLKSSACPGVSSSVDLLKTTEGSCDLSAANTFYVWPAAECVRSHSSPNICTLDAAHNQSLLQDNWVVQHHKAAILKESVLKIE